MKQQTIYLVLSVILGSVDGYAGEFDDILKLNRFMEYPIPKSTPEWEETLSDKNTYFVETTNGEITILTEGNSSHNKYLQKYDAGNIKYEGINQGEWGGELTAIYSDGTKQELITDNIVSILPYYEDGKSGLYIFTGLAHMSLSRGAIYVIENYEIAPVVKKLTLLPDAPEVVITDKYKYDDSNYFIIIGSSALMTYEPDRDDLEIILIDQSLLISPTSAIKKNDEILVGIRSGVVVIDITERNKSVRFFKKTESNHQLLNSTPKSGAN